MSEGNAHETQKPSGQVAWGQVAKGGGRGSGAPRSLWSQVEKLKVKDPNTQYRVRLIGDPYQFNKLYEPIEVNLDPGYNRELEVFKAGNNPSPRYAVWVFDRNDGNKIKLFENGPMIFRQFGTYQEIIGDDPGGPDGPDWSLSFNDPVGENGKPNPRQRQYRTMHIKPAPFTEEEKKRIAEHIARFPYGQVIKGAEDDYINKLWEEAKNAKEGAFVPGSYRWYMDKKNSSPEHQQAAQDLTLDDPKGDSDDAEAAPEVNTDAKGDGFEDVFKTAAPAGGQKSGGTSLF